LFCAIVDDADDKSMRTINNILVFVMPFKTKCKITISTSHPIGLNLL
jgi:hypothetical protein